MAGINLPFILSVTMASLATGYYLGQIYGGATHACLSELNAQAVLKQVKDRAESASRDAEELDSTYEDDSDEEVVEVSSLPLNDIPGEVRMALVIRQDLGMTKGKIAAQCCHAALACYRLMAEDVTRVSYNRDMVMRWLQRGQAKITLKCPDKETMDELFAKAMALGVNCHVVHDAGRTQIAAGSATVLGLGPAPKAVLDEITGELKLY
ncbi:ABR210Wp [Eremothecium gossypii ATCC 10895]|uniref:peptidyl-tRNA hydrolase n=1 Tax=Eremothecium gossypii (strain ATCC 10895 / CBS 109.51 / FGSC 9923 / NRRL Y-1056) TaxID=284811 RepID=Q75D12_EREGS|nr:ABR210Wp [Eremothecium gossypii ATCC 10895]AAS50983.1 ABR210Wp [Eremothecium gossypii ATCC 10895]AEY95272.1 FABR210Wp [Eremothecium gossypii FDAG1]